MYTLAIVAGMAAFGAASPAPQALDLAAVLAASPASMSGPPLSAVTQTGFYNTNSATATISVSSVASASAAPATTTLAAKLKRDTSSASSGASSSASSSHTFCWGSYPNNICIGGNYDTAAPPNFYPTTTILSTKVATTTTSSSTACPTVPEAGTLCGFINPEDNCAPQPLGNGPHVEPDTVAAFYAYPPFHALAQNAITPKSYINTFKDLNASSQVSSYIGLYTLSSYDVDGCSKWCDNTTLCTAFNIYVERDPALNPSASQCTNTSSITNYKCTLFASGLDKTTATNMGGWRSPTFQSVVAASNGYDKSNSTLPPTCPGWQPPQSCGGKAHNHPSTCLGSRFIPGPYNPSLCAALAAAQNKANSSTSFWFSLLSFLFNPLKCNFFNSYALTKNSKHMGTYCTLYSQQYNPSLASYVPGWQSSNFYGVGQSHSYCSS